ncbi:MAG TPA: alpha-ketoglutarate-dependent dioxygenase AlkB [Chryseosolibacter sp.]
MDTLFPPVPVYPPGFTYVPDFLTEEEEQQLIREISGIELHAFNFHGYEAKRRVASFGYDYRFDQRSLVKGREIPGAFQNLVGKVASKTGISKEEFVELLVTEYPEGSVINWHRDAFPFDVIAGVSLLSDCTFRLRPHDKTKRVRGSIISLPVKRRSLYLIAGKARTEWQHSISPVQSVRYSLTLRTLRNPPGRS